MNRLLLIALAVGVLAACGQDVCHHGPTECTALQNKAAACPKLPAVTCSSYSSVQMQNCENSMSKCSSTDIASLNAMFSCFDRIPNCVPGQETQFSAQYAACVAGLSVSSGCDSYN